MRTLDTVYVDYWWCFEHHSCCSRGEEQWGEPYDNVSFSDWLWLETGYILPLFVLGCGLGTSDFLFHRNAPWDTFSENAIFPKIDVICIHGWKCNVQHLFVRFLHLRSISTIFWQCNIQAVLFSGCVTVTFSCSTFLRVVYIIAGLVDALFAMLESWGLYCRRYGCECECGHFWGHFVCVPLIEDEIISTYPCLFICCCMLELRTHAGSSSTHNLLD